MGDQSLLSKLSRVVLVLAFGVAACTGGSDDGAAEETPPEASESAPEPEETGVVAVIGSDDRLTTFNDLLEAAGWDETLGSDGPVTVLAPTDEAFSSVPPEIIEELKSDPAGSLSDLLGFHVVDDEITAAELEGLSAQTVATRSGVVPVLLDAEGRIAIDGGRVVEADLEGDDGVVHVIDVVILEAA